MVYHTNGVTSSLFIHDLPCGAEGGRVKGRLWDEAVGERNAQEAGNTSAQAKQKNIPMEAGWLTQRKFAALSNE